jgi:ComF family protein
MSIIAESFAPLVDLIYPPRCPACGEGVGDQNGLCLSCWSTLEIPSGRSCAACQSPLGGSDLGQADEAGLCDACLAYPPQHSGIAAATVYTDTSRKLILSFKHGRKITLSAMLARLIAAQLGPLAGRLDEPLLVPVPLHRLRIWQRGFNQSALLARELAKIGQGALLVDGLRRRKRTPPLGGLGAEARKQMLAEAIVVPRSKKRSIAGRDIILVDDVLTSGATSEACVRALKDAGARHVVIACFARVLPGRGFGQPAV